jgi:hypothetical protein
MNRNLIRHILFLSLSSFCLALLSMAFHHHDNAFRLPTCSICEAKTSLSGTTGKFKADSGLSAAIGGHGPVPIPADDAGKAVDSLSLPVPCSSSFRLFNKAPPSASPVLELSLWS